jgi:cell division protein FtsW (lipid II flippase)
VLVRKEDDLQQFKKGLLPRLVVVGLVLVLIAAQPDLGSQE